MYTKRKRDKEFLILEKQLAEEFEILYTIYNLYVSSKDERYKSLLDESRKKIKQINYKYKRLLYRQIFRKVPQRYMRPRMSNFINIGKYRHRKKI